jgi:hypothetical protein
MTTTPSASKPVEAKPAVKPEAKSPTPPTAPAGAAKVPEAAPAAKSPDAPKKPAPVDLTEGPTTVSGEFEKALKESDQTDVSEEDLDELDRLENGGKTLEEVNKAENDAERVVRQQKEHDQTELRAAYEKLVRIDAVVQSGTPDSHTAWGVGGVILTLGDIRKIARAFVKNGSRV